MGLTQVSTDGVKNDAITKTKIPANQIEASELADNAVDTNAIADNAVSSAKIPTNAVTQAKIADDAVGADQLASNAVVTASIADNAITQAKINVPISNRNLIINGAMQVAQRGTSDSGITQSGYTVLDRYKVGGSSFGTVTVSQSTDSPDGFSNSYKVDVTTANGSLSAGSLLEIQQSLEGQDVQAFAKGTSAAKQYSLSFYVKSTKTGTYVAMLQDHDNSRMCCKTYTVSDTNWNRYTLTYPADTTGAFGNDNQKSLSVKFCLVAGTTFTSGTLQTTWGTAANATSRVGQVNFADSTSNDWYVTGVQLEVGSVATPFEHRRFGDELERCKRYFYRWNSGGTSSEAYFLQSGAYSSHANSAFFDYTYQPAMRSTPTATTPSVDNQSSGSWSLYATRARWIASATSSSAGAVFTSQIDFSAEL